MRNLFETTWTCDRCGGPNLQTDVYCRHCGAEKPSRYKKTMVRSKVRENFFIPLF